MNAHFLSIEEFNELLHAWNGKQIMIEKIEQDELDQIKMNLDTISYSKNPNVMEGDYESLYTLELNGDGEIITDNHYQPLPEPQYEIPIEDTALYEFDGEKFLLSTNRGVYKIGLYQQ